MNFEKQKNKREVFNEQKKIRKYSRKIREYLYINYEATFEGEELTNLKNTTDNFTVPLYTRTAKKIIRREGKKLKKDLLYFLPVP
ncbi:MAG: hypothetical protein V1655_01295 [bacterium]